jgi:hypothetical protein
MDGQFAEREPIMAGHDHEQRVDIQRLQAPACRNLRNGRAMRGQFSCWCGRRRVSKDRKPGLIPKLGASWPPPRLPPR